MARPQIFSNGELHVGINTYGLVHDFYFPHVGLENHSAGSATRHKIGVWVDGKISWLDDGKWKFRFASSHTALIGTMRAHNAELEVILETESFVDAEQNVFFRTIHIINTAAQTRDIRLFMHQAFVIGDRRSNGDTAQYLPDSQAIVHYRGQRVFVIGARSSQQDYFDQHSIGLFGIEGKEGTFRDADDGELAGSNVEHGRVDSTVRLRFEIAPHSSERAEYWVSAGLHMRSALRAHKRCREEDNIHARLTATAAWWHTWLEPALSHVERILPAHQTLFTKSLLVIKAHCDKRGAVIASSDSAMLNYSRDNYSYCWPRDGAYALWPLIRLGFIDEPRAFFEFCRDAMHPHGYLMHKFLADGSVGSSWHPYLHDDISAPPIQADETASTVFMFGQFYDAHHDQTLLEQFYETMIAPMANFLASYIDETTHLPKPSYDLWEEKFLTSTYTTALTRAALQTAAELADSMHSSEQAVAWRAVADDISSQAAKYLYNAEKGYLRKGFLRHNDGTINYDETLDTSSLYGAFMYGLFPFSGKEIRSTFAAIEQTLSSANHKELLPRYQGDTYRRADAATANPWLITSLWRAQYLLELDDKASAEAALAAIEQLATSTGMLPEQVVAATQQTASVEPLVWSHAEFVSTLLDCMTDGDKKS